MKRRASIRPWAGALLMAASPFLPIAEGAFSAWTLGDFAPSLAPACGFGLLGVTFTLLLVRRTWAWLPAAAWVSGAVFLLLRGASWGFERWWFEECWLLPWGWAAAILGGLAVALSSLAELRASRRDDPARLARVFA